MPGWVFDARLAERWGCVRWGVLVSLAHVQYITSSLESQHAATSATSEMHDHRAFEDQRGTRRIGVQLNIVYFCIRGELCHK